MAGRILVGLLALSLVPIIVVAFQGYHCGTQAVLESVSTGVASIAENRGIQLEQWLDQRRNELDLLAASLQDNLIWTRLDSDSRTTDKAESPGHIVDTFMAHKENYESLVIYDRAWNVRFSRQSGHSHPDKDFDRSDIRQLLSADSETSVSRVHRHGHGDIGVHFGARLLDEGGSHQGYVLAAVDLASTLNRTLYDREGMSDEDKVFLVDAKGLLLTEPDPISSSHALDSDIEIYAVDGELNGVYRNYEGREVIGAAAPLESIDWRLVVERDLAEAMRWQFILARRAGSTVLITLVLICVFAWMMSRSLSRPLRKLEGVAERVRLGDHSARASGIELPEARGVGMALNAMLDELQLTQQRLAHSAALSAVGQVSSSVVHEMRNPLSSVKMNLQAIAPAVASRVDLKELSDIALSQVLRIETMLGDLLNFAKPMSPKLRELKLTEVVEAAVETVRGEAEAKDVRILSLEELEGASASVDKELLCQAVTNLLANAIQASPSGRPIQVSIKRHKSEPGLACIEVTDEGEGVSAENQDRLFNPFFSTKDEGTGLGLANVKKIAEYHSGSVETENRPGRGVLFRMILPLSKGAQA